MTNKTKAQLLAENRELAKKLKDCEGAKVEAPVVSGAFFEKWGPMLLAGGVLAAFLFFKGGINVDPTPTPVPPVPEVELTVKEFFPGVRDVYRQVFIDAAEKVKSGEIKTDKELFDYVQPSLIKLRQEKQRPFDQLFQMSLPRGDDGSFVGKEAEVEQFLRKIAESW